MDLAHHDDLLQGGLVAGNSLGFIFFIVLHCKFFCSIQSFINLAHVDGTSLSCLRHLTRTRHNELTVGWTHA